MRKYMIGVLMGTLVFAGGTVATAQSVSGLKGRVTTFISAFNSRNVANAMKPYHLNYFDGEYDYTDTCAFLGIIFGARGYTMKMNGFRQTYAEVQGNYGYIEYTLTIRATQDGVVIGNDTFNLAEYFVWEGGKWWLYGSGNFIRPESQVVKPRILDAVKMLRQSRTSP